MNFSTKSTYGLKAMIKLAGSQDQKKISLSKIAKEENISQGYLERLFSSLKKAGLVKAERGVLGGYELTKNPEDISIYEIIKALESHPRSFYCFDEKNKIYCNKKCDCSANSMLLKIEDSVNRVLKNLKLSKFI